MVSEIDIGEKLSGLNAKDLQKISSIIDKLANKKDNTPKRSRKKNQPKKQNSNNTKKRIRRVNQHKPAEKVRRKGGGSKGISCATESFDTNKERPNLFLERGLHKLEKQDIAVDKLLSGNNEITERQPTRLYYL